MNKGLSTKIISILSKDSEFDTPTIFKQLQKTYPNISNDQMHGTLSRLVKHGAIERLARGLYGNSNMLAKYEKRVLKTEGRMETETEAQKEWLEITILSKMVKIAEDLKTVKNMIDEFRRTK